MKTMKRILALMLAVMLIFSLAACTRQRQVIVYGSDYSESESATDGNPDNDTQQEGEGDSATTPSQSDDESTTDEDGEGDAAADPTEGGSTSAAQADGKSTTAAKTESDGKPASTTAPAKDKVTTSTQSAKDDGKPAATTKSNKVSGTTGKTQQQTTNAAPTMPARPATDVVYRNFTIKSSTKTVESEFASQFKGKTYTSLIWTENATEAYKKELEAFAKEYGCTIRQDKITFEKVMSHMATKLSTGDSYDIVRLHAMWYPRMMISGLCKPLEDSFTTADVITDKNKACIDLEKSTNFAWGNRLYGITTYDDVPLIYFYYNKKLYSQYIGANKLPMTLYNKGEWDWDTIKSHADIVSKSNSEVLYGDSSLAMPNTVLANGTRLVKSTKVADGVKLQLNMIGNKELTNSLKFIQGLLGYGVGVGLYQPKKVISPDGGGIDPKHFVNGNTLVWVSESTRYETVYNQVMTSGAFGANKDERIANLCIAPFPLGPDNQGGKYAGNWLTGFAAGRGSQATSGQLVAALCKYHSTYKNTSDVPMPTAQEQSVMNTLYDNLYFPDYGFGTAEETIKGILDDIIASISRGDDITTTVKKQESIAQRCLKDSLSAQS